MRLLWVSHTAWDVPQRAHPFCRALADRHEVHVAESLGGSTSVSDYLTRHYLRGLRYARYRDGRIVIHRIPRFSPALHVAPLRRLNTRIFRRYVERLVEHHRIECVVGTFHLPPIDGPRLIFDSFDANAAYWRHLDRAKGYANEIALTEYRYLQEADAVVAASSVLADKARALIPRGPVYHIPNGVDLRRFDGLDRVAARMQLGIDGPVIGSVANYDQASELDLVLDAARIVADRGVVFLLAGRGRALAHAMARASHERIRNVVFRGFVPPEAAPALISSFDVGLCSYRRTPMDDARTPMRLLMYAAAGLPTVCTDLDEVRRMGFANVVRVNDDPEAIATGVLAALDMPRVRPPQIEHYDLDRLVARYEAVLLGQALEPDDPPAL
jgi:glycosyltransferase involved in cell wall biosynthesis